MLNYSLLLISVVFLLAGTHGLIRSADMTKKKLVALSAIVTLFTGYSFFFIFSHYISGNGVDKPVVYFLYDTVVGYSWWNSLLFAVLLASAGFITFTIVYVLIRKAAKRIGFYKEKSIKSSSVFYFLLILSFISAPASYGIVRNFVMDQYAEMKDTANRYDINRFIAHSGGMIDGHIYTNSLEALNNSYKSGFRLFELDILRTSDGHFVAAHNWKQWKDFTGYQGELPPDRDNFKQQKILQKYAPLDMDDINAWFENHPDAILVTDKINDPAAFSNLFVDKSRLMMELFTMDAVKEALATGIRSAMPTWGLLKEMKRDKVRELKDMGITDIAASRRVIKYNIPLFQELQKNGIRVYVFHVNYDKKKDENYVVQYDMDYVYGMYADTFDFTSLSQIHPNPNPH